MSVSKERLAKLISELKDFGVTDTAHVEEKTVLLSALRELAALREGADALAEAQRIYPDPVTFPDKIRRAINSCSKENASDTPDFILADYLVACLDAYSETVKRRDKWFNFVPWGANNQPLPIPPPFSPGAAHE